MQPARQHDCTKGLPMNSAALLSTLCAMLCAALLPFTAANAQASAPYHGHGAQSVDDATLERYRPKPLPEELSRRIQALLDLRSPGSGALTPDGRTLFFGWRVTGTDQVWRLDGPNAFPRQMTAGEDRTTLAAITRDGRWLVLQRDRKGEENPGLYLQSVDGGALVEIQHKARVQTEFQAFTEDGRALYFVANDVRPETYALYRTDLATRQTQRVLGGGDDAIAHLPGYWRVADVGNLGGEEHLLLLRAVNSRQYEWYDYATGERTLKSLLGQGEQQTDELHYGAQPDEFFVRTDRLDGRSRAYRWHPSRGVSQEAFERILVGPPQLQGQEVDALGVDDARSRLYVSLNASGYTRSFALDARTLRPLPLPYPEGLDHETVDFVSHDGRLAILGLASPGAPRASAVLDWSNGGLTRWTVPSTPELDTRRFVPATLESYPARDGTPIPMFVRRPPQCAQQAEPCPVIVHFHGGPEGQSRPGFSPIWQFFVDAGFVIVEPNVRGSSGYGRAWLDADNGAKRLDVITDIEDAAIHIRHAFARNGRAPKVGVYGASYGGYAALMAMTRFGGAYDAGVSNVGIANLLTFLENTAPYRRALRASEYGDPQADRDALIALSPTTYIDRLQGPLFIIQGANDPRVPVGEALQMNAAAARRGVPLELMIFPDEGHGAASRANIALQWGHTLRFFQQYLR
jgi:dipeptidyl aminopeptidase/acylaminoacyl peptidase